MDRLKLALQAAIASDENIKGTLDLLRNVGRSDDAEGAICSTPDFFQPGESTSTAEFASLFLDNFRKQAENILAAAQAAWNQEHRKAQDAGAISSRTLPSGKPNVAIIRSTDGQFSPDRGSRPSSSAYRAVTAHAAEPGALDFNSFPALGSTPASSTKHGKVQAL